MDSLSMIGRQRKHLGLGKFFAVALVCMTFGIVAQPHVGQVNRLFSFFGEGGKLREANEQLTAELATLKQTQEQTQTELTSSNSEKAQLAANLDSTSNELAAAKLQLAAAQGELKSAQTQTAEMNGRLDELQRTASDKNGTLDKARRDVDRLREVVAIDDDLMTGFTITFDLVGQLLDENTTEPQMLVIAARIMSEGKRIDELMEKRNRLM